MFTDRLVQLVCPLSKTTLFPYTTLFRSGLETLVIIMEANKYAFLQITRRRFLNEWEAFKKVISRTRTYSPPRSEERFSRNAETDVVCRLLLEKKTSPDARGRSRTRRAID